MRADDRIIVDIYDPSPRVGGAGDLVHVALRGQAGADVHELAEAGRRHQVPHHPAQERPVGAGARWRIRSHLQGEFDNGAISGVVILPAEEGVIDPRDIRPRHVQARRDDALIGHCDLP